MHCCNKHCRNFTHCRRDSLCYRPRILQTEGLQFTYWDGCIAGICYFKRFLESKNIGIVKGRNFGVRPMVLFIFCQARRMMRAVGTADQVVAGVDKATYSKHLTKNQISESGAISRLAHREFCAASLFFLFAEQ